VIRPEDVTSQWERSARFLRIKACGALRRDDDSVVGMCLRLYREDPGPLPVPAENMHATLEALRGDPRRGRAVVLDIQGQVSGYAVLIAFWSNELGGDICVVDGPRPAEVTAAASA
jgi:hypothetical protein